MGEMGAVPTAPQRRKHPRFALRCPVHLRFLDEQQPFEVNVFSRNVSIAGLLLEWDLPAPNSKNVAFVIILAGGPLLHPIRLAGLGEVVRVESGETITGSGLAIACTRPIGEIEEYFCASSGQAD